MPDDDEGDMIAEELAARTEASRRKLTEAVAAARQLLTDEEMAEHYGLDIDEVFADER